MKSLDLQNEHRDHRPSSKKFNLCILADGVEIADNIGGLLRVADAFGLDKVFFAGSDIDLKIRKIRRVSRSCEKHVEFKEVSDSLETLRYLKEQGYTCVVLDRTQKSISLDRFSFDKHSKFCLVLGSEKKGVGPEVLNFCDAALHIPMFGVNSSMNVVVAGAIASYHLINGLNPVEQDEV